MGIVHLKVLYGFGCHEGVHRNPVNPKRSVLQMTGKYSKMVEQFVQSPPSEQINYWAFTDKTLFWLQYQ